MWNNRNQKTLVVWTHFAYKWAMDVLDDVTHDPESIAMQAKKLITEYGDNAEDVATDAMYGYMESEDVNKAAVWLAVISEIRQLAQSSASVN